MDLSGLGTGVGFMFSLLVTGAGGWMVARRKMSRDGVELTKDRTEINIIEHLTKQRDEAFALEKETRAAKESLENSLAESKAEVEKLKQNIQQMTRQINLMNTLVKGMATTLDMTKEELKKILQSKPECKIDEEAPKVKTPRKKKETDE